MASYVIKVLDSNTTRDRLERVIRQSEQVDFTAVSLAAGIVGGRAANVLTLSAEPPTGTVSLVVIGGSGDDNRQSDQVTDAADQHAVVSYAGVYVGGELQNVAMIRS
jgi:uncharacterized membrane protein YebE (DUF533 family)